MGIPLVLARCASEQQIQRTSVLSDGSPMIRRTARGRNHEDYTLTLSLRRAGRHKKHEKSRSRKNQPKTATNTKATAGDILNMLLGQALGEAVEATGMHTIQPHIGSERDQIRFVSTPHPLLQQAPPTI